MKLPFVANPGAILLLFLAEVIVLHVVLIIIRPWRPKKTGWAIVQYAVILLAIVGLTGAIANVRLRASDSVHRDLTIVPGINESRTRGNLHSKFGLCRGFFGLTIHAIVTHPQERVTSPEPSIFKPRYMLNPDSALMSSCIAGVVAIDHEFAAIRKAFEDKGASVTMSPKNNQFIVNHSEYRVAVRKGKHHVDSFYAALRLFDDDEAKWLIMIGIAGSLGTEKNGKSIEPKLGDVVIGSSLGPYRIRDKIREDIKNAPVPLWEQEWLAIPVDPTLFVAVHAAASKTFPKGSGVTCL